jgi:hypothetical protein
MAMIEREEIERAVISETHDAFSPAPARQVGSMLVAIPKIQPIAIFQRRDRAISVERLNLE